MKYIEEETGTKEARQCEWNMALLKDVIPTEYAALIAELQVRAGGNRSVAGEVYSLLPPADLDMPWRPGGTLSTSSFTNRRYPSCGVAKILGGSVHGEQ